MPPEPGSDEGLLRNVDAYDRWEASRPTRRARWRYILFGAQPAPVPSFRGTVEPPQDSLAGVCCSGGGVRSAAFNLGALQALTCARELQRSRYLAAVSGGSYIAAAFSMIAKTWPAEEKRRPPDDPEHPYNGHDDSNPRLLDEQPPFACGSPEEQYLRNRSSYLAPSAMDKLYLAYRIVLGVLFNVAFLALPLFGIGMLLAVLLYRPLFPHLLGSCGASCSASVPTGMWAAPVAIGGLSALLGLCVLLLRLPKDHLRTGFEVWSVRLLVLAAIVAWLTIALPLLVDVVTVGGSTGAPAGKAGAVGGGGFTALIVAVAAHLREALVSPSKLVSDAEEASKRWAALSSWARRLIAYAAAAIVGPALLLGAMVFGAALALAHSTSAGIDGWLVLAGGGSIALFALVYACVDLTSWSLHPFYKRRLCTAFALKRVRPSDQGPKEEGHAEVNVAQEEEQGIAVERDFDRLVPLSHTALVGGQWPTLLVCAAANVSDPGATPPGRSVTSFTFSARAIGGPLVGAIDTHGFENAFARSRSGERKGGRSRDLSLPSAVAMSGAALSPSMGKLTSRPLTFLMALANIRLGVWVPNPRWVSATRERDRRSYGRARPSYLLRELFGRNRVSAKYLYVTDGGHYENLGLVELLRRGCTEIYCFDASGGKSFEVLGDACALARSELGVEIAIDPSDLVPDAKGVAEADAVRGLFEYRDGRQGKLVYVRTVMTAQTPWDVIAYHEQDPSFPNDPTVDQLYTDQRFEAYRALGFSSAGNAIALMTAAVEGGEGGSQDGEAGRESVSANI